VFFKVGLILVASRDYNFFFCIRISLRISSSFDSFFYDTGYLLLLKTDYCLPLIGYVYEYLIDYCLLLICYVYGYLYEVYYFVRSNYLVGGIFEIIIELSVEFLVFVFMVMSLSNYFSYLLNSF
jgi:hypothetical protein